MSKNVVVITGAKGVLGGTLAKSFAAEGMQCLLVDLRWTDAERQALGIEGAVFVSADLTNAEDTAKRLGEAVEKVGRVDILCNVAGGFAMGEKVHETSEATWDKMIGMNALTVLNTARAIVPHMLKAGQGRIVNVAATAGLNGKANMGAYGVSKSAVQRLTESMAAELGPEGIHVNCIMPSIIDTPDNRAAMPDANRSAWVAPSDIVEVIRFLASPSANAVNGAAIPVAGRYGLA